MKIREIDPTVGELVKQNGGYCPCAVQKNADAVCPCREFREQVEGKCRCGRYEWREEVHQND